MRLALLALTTLVAVAQNAPLTIPAYDMFRYATAGKPSRIDSRRAVACFLVEIVESGAYVRQRPTISKE